MNLHKLKMNHVLVGIIITLTILVGIHFISSPSKEEIQTKPETEKSKEKKVLIPQAPVLAEPEKIPPPSPSNEAAKLKKALKGSRLIGKLKKELKHFDTTRLSELKHSLISKKELDPSEFAIEFLNSENDKTRNFGYELMTAICIERPEKFKPNEFYKFFAKNGLLSSGLLSEIIEKTDDDFCREWACELSVDIYYHNSPEEDSRKSKILEYKNKEQNIYNFLKEALSSEEKLKTLETERGKLSDIIINQWGKENRFPLKMQALISTLDLMNENNLGVCASQALKIIETYNFNYNILGWMNGKKLEQSPLPEETRLKKFADAVLKDQYKDTYSWLPKGNGGFTYDELEIAVKTGDRKAMRKMLAGFRKIISAFLKQKILIGLGNRELDLLRHFNQKTWGKDEFHWSNKIVEVSNHSGREVLLFLKRKNSSDTIESFTIPGRSKFVWFLPEGEYLISGPNNARAGFYKEFSIKEKNITVDISRD